MPLADPQEAIVIQDLDETSAVEQAAAGIVRSALRVDVRDRDARGPRRARRDMEPDFDLHRPGGPDPFGVLEVTMLTDADYRRFADAVERHGGRPAPTLTKDWHVWSDDEFIKVKAFQGRLPLVEHALAALEAQGRDGFQVEDGWVAQGDTAVRALRDARLTGGMAASPKGPVAAIHLEGPGMTSTPRPGFTVDAALAAIADNAAKLLQFPDLERHLFVWVGVTRVDAWLALSHATPPASPVKLPPAVTTLWVAAEASERVVWRTTPDGTWSRVELAN